MVERLSYVRLSPRNDVYNYNNNYYYHQFADDDLGKVQFVLVQTLVFELKMAISLIVCGKANHMHPPALIHVDRVASVWLCFLFFCKTMFMIELVTIDNGPNGYIYI